MKLNNYIEKADLKTLKLLKSLYHELLELKRDPISYEFQMLRLLRSNKLLVETDIINFSNELITLFPKIVLDNELLVIKMSTDYFAHVLQTIDAKEEKLNSLLKKEKSKKTSDVKNKEEEIIKMSAILKEMYYRAPKGFQMTFLHLFGLMYYEKLKNLPVKKISLLATGKENLHVEIGKGMKLYGYVSLNEDYLKKAIR